MAVIVNGENIPESALREEMDRMRPSYRRTFPGQSEAEQEKTLREWARENLIERALLRQAAAADPRPIPRGEIEKRLETLREEHGDEADLLKIFGLAENELPALEKQVDLQLRVERLVRELGPPPPEPTEEEARRFYREHRREFTTPERAEAAHIVKHVGPETSAAEAEKILREAERRLQAGESFESLASELSDCPDNSGSLGWFPHGEMVPEFEDVVFSLEPGEVSGVFRTPFGFHIARLYRKEPERVSPFSEVREEVLKKAAEEQRDRILEEYLDERRAEADIKDVPEKPASRKKTASSPRRRTVPSKGERTVQRKVLRSILVKPSGPDCNMRCRYCFYLEKDALFEAAPRRMSEEVLEAMVRQALEGGAPQVNFGWQGGEPTLMGLDFFRKAVEFQRIYGRGRTVGNGFQTNGLLLDESWADFFREHAFLVGLSLDGPRDVHDRYRRTAGGEGTWEKVTAAARMLLDRGVETNALVVLTRESVNSAAEIYRFHKDLGLNYMQFIPCVESLPGQPGIPAPFSVPPDAFGEALCTLFDLWMGDFDKGRPATSVRFFDSLFHRYVGLPPPECTLLEECGIYTVVEHNGDVYSCDFFVAPEWRLGNVLRDELPALLNSARQRKFGRLKASLPRECRACRWLPLCRGGCPKDRLGEPGRPRLNYLCRGYQRFFEHADARLRDLAETWLRERAGPDPGTAASTVPPERPPVSPVREKAGRNQLCPCGSGLKYKKCCGK